MLKLKYSWSHWLVLVAMCLVMAEQPAFALYVDPGSGTLLWQLIGAALIGGIYHVRRVILGPLLSFIKRHKPKATDPEQ